MLLVAAALFAARGGLELREESRAVARSARAPFSQETGRAGDPRALARAAATRASGAGRVEPNAARAMSAPDPLDRAHDVDHSSEAARASEGLALAASDEPVRLDAPSLAPGEVTVLLSGHDPAGPRPLLLWRLREARSAPLAEGRSTPSGRLVFPPIAASTLEDGLVVLPRGAAPGARAAARAVPAPVMALAAGSNESPRAGAARSNEEE